MSSLTPLPEVRPSTRTFLQWLLESLRFVRGRVRVKWNRYCERRIDRLKREEEDLARMGKHPLQRLRRDPNFPCPACGARDGQVKWASALKFKGSEQPGVLVHQCNICKAPWGEPPIFAAADWRISLTSEETRLFTDQKNATVATVAEIAKNA